MTVKISVFAIVLIASYVSAGGGDYQPSTSTLSMTLPFMPYYPMDGPVYTSFKKAIYTLNQALGNICFSAQNVYDYYKLYKNQQGLNLEFNESKVRFDSAIQHFDEKLSEYRQALMNYKLLLGYNSNNVPISLDDNIGIDSNLL